jgi:serine/threonine protein kinase
MTPERWLLIKELFHAALVLAPDERAAYLDEACDGDLSLKAEIESLIAAHEDSEHFLETTTADLDEAVQADDQSEPLVGRSIGPYNILARLGAGGMAAVYLAQDTRLGRKVALKLMGAHSTKDEDRVLRFQMEARAASSLNHPNIVTIHEIGEAEEGHFIVMELIEGHTLRELINTRPTMQLLARLGVQMARALSVAHAAGIIHRDIKPENIMVRGDGYVKVLDFGVARLSQIDTQTERNITGKLGAATAPGIILGTLGYMSPEQARAEQLTNATDIFSLGIVLYELATGQHPFSAGSQIGVLHGIISQPVLSPSRLNPEISEPLETLLLHMLEKDSRSRPGAAEVEITLSGLDANPSGSFTHSLAVSRKRNTVGREKERAHIREAYDCAVAGRGSFLCVSGEVGIGKTTLIEDFLADVSATDQKPLIVRGRCSERLAGTEAYLPFLEALENLLRSELRDLVARAMKLIAPTWYVQVAPFSDESISGAHLREDIKTASQERLKRELSALLEEVSRNRPLVFFLDDLHWADISTVELLAYLANHFEQMRVLILTTHRSSDLLIANHPFLQVKRDLQARGICHQIHLQFLSLEEIERYLALEFPEHAFPKEFPALIYQKTEGSPLFMVDLVRYLKDEGVIAEQQERWQIVRDANAIEGKLPESVRGMIQRKMDQLDEADLSLLLAASVQGYEFDSAVIARALWQDPAEIEERLRSLDRIHAFIRLVKEREFPDRTLTLRYRFVHVLYQNALYASLVPTRRAALSASVAEALLDFYGDQHSVIASRLALLFEAARDFTRASEYFLIASENAARVSANQEAVALSQRRLEIVKMLPDTGDLNRDR